MHLSLFLLKCKDYQFINLQYMKLKFFSSASYFHWQRCCRFRFILTIWLVKTLTYEWIFINSTTHQQMHCYKRKNKFLPRWHTLTKQGRMNSCIILYGVALLGIPFNRCLFIIKFHFCSKYVIYRHHMSVKSERSFVWSWFLVLLECLFVCLFLLLFL